MSDAAVTLTQGDALIIIDVLNDFLPGGVLPVAGGEEVIAPLNEYIARFQAASLAVVAARDWHLDAHCSFTQNGGPWPMHCVAETPGAEFPAALTIPDNAVIISKATTNNRDYYSVFSGTELDQLLELMMTKRVFIGGLSIDNCVLNSARDAVGLKLKTFILDDAFRSNPPPVLGEEFATEEELTKIGVLRTTLSSLK